MTTLAWRSVDRPHIDNIPRFIRISFPWQLQSFPRQPGFPFPISRGKAQHDVEHWLTEVVVDDVVLANGHLCRWYTGWGGLLLEQSSWYLVVLVRADQATEKGPSDLVLHTLADERSART